MEELNKTITEVFKSKNGVEYEVTYEDITTEEMEQLRETKHFVDWDPDGEWHETDSKTYNETKIRKYKLDPKNKGFYNNKLYFVNEKHYCYYFEDATGDVYKVNTYINRTHTVAYNSKNPKIIAIYSVKY